MPYPFAGTNSRRGGLFAHLLSDVHLPHRTQAEREEIFGQGGGRRRPDLRDVFFEGGERRGEGRHTDMLFLCGDVGSPMEEYYERFLQRATDCYSLVVLVPGNHEYVHDGKPTATAPWGKPSFDRIDDRLRQLELRLDRLRVLTAPETHLRVSLPAVGKGERRTPSLTLLGATLWSDVDPRDDEAASQKLSASYAWFRGRALEPDDLRRLHRSQVAGLRRSIRKASVLARDPEEHEICVLTHHCPWGKARGKLESLYVTDLPASAPDLFLPPVRTWCYGHTHKPYDGRVGSCRLVSNPLGYPKERLPLNRRLRLSFGS